MSEKCVANASTRSMNFGLPSRTSASKTVAAHSGSRPTSERTLSGIRVPSGMRMTS